MNLLVRGRSRVIDVLLLAAVMVAGPIPAFAAETHQFDVPTEDAPAAIRDFASQAHVQILVAGENVTGKHFHPVSGEFSTEQGLRILLADSGLSPRYVGDRSIALVNASDANSPSQAYAAEGKKSSQDFRVAQVDPGVAGTAPIATSTQNSANDQSGSPALTEIIVTAQKRAERLQEVPVPVTAINANTLVENNQLRLQDYYTSVPGLSVTPADFRGDPILTIRGIASGGAFTNPTVGIVIDDVPYGSSTGISGSSAIDIDPTELERVEVLRGPQGTLYGASSIGGLLKYVTVDPSVAGLSGRIQAGTSSVYNGPNLGYNVSAAANVPLSDTWAVRVSGFTREDPGYVDNVETGQRAVNEAEVDGGRLSALWKPTESFSLKLSALVQEIKVFGSPDVEPGLGDLKQSAVRDTGTYNKNTQAYSAIVTAKLGVVDFTSLSGYSVNKISDSYDLTNGISPMYSEDFFGAASTIDHENLRTTKYSQEIRFSASVGQRFEWLIGAFYTHEATPDVTSLLAADPATGLIAGALLNSDSFPTTYQEYAIFTDLTFHVTDRFDVQVGGRESQNRQTYHETLIGIADEDFFGLPSPVVQPEIDTKDTSFTYLVTPRFKVSSDLMLYARLASGYRAGGPNTTASLLGVPPEYAPDTTRNYEIGAKGDLLSNRLSIDASLYYIDWRDMQLQLAAPNGAYYYANASRSKSQGLELSADSRPLQGLTLAAWVAWNDAVLTKDIPLPSTPGTFPPAYGVTGDRLPYSARFSGNFSLQQEFPLWSRVTGFAGGALSYVGNRESVFTSSAERQNLPAYAKPDFRAGAKYESWQVNLFVDNATDRRGVLSGGLGGAINPLAFNYIQPRTVGVSVSKTF